jgi:hypothetical protein
LTIGLGLLLAAIQHPEHPILGLEVEPSAHFREIQQLSANCTTKWDNPSLACWWR